MLKRSGVAYSNFYFSLQTNFSLVCLRQPFIPEILLRPGVRENVSASQPPGRQPVANCSLKLVQKTGKKLTLADAYHAQARKLARQIASESDEQKAIEELSTLRRQQMCQIRFYGPDAEYVDFRPDPDSFLLKFFTPEAPRNFQGLFLGPRGSNLQKIREFTRTPSVNLRGCGSQRSPGQIVNPGDDEPLHLRAEIPRDASWRGLADLAKICVDVCYNCLQDDRHNEYKQV